MRSIFVIALGSGLATALLTLAAAKGGVLAFILLSVMAPLPCYLAGLCWGTLMAALSVLIALAAVGAVALAGELGLGIALGANVTLLDVLGQLLPAVVLCHLALLGRERPTGEEGAPGREWYPPGRLVAAATLMAAPLGLLTPLLRFGDTDAQRRVLRTYLDQFFQRLPQLQTRPLGEPEMARIVELFLYLMPGVAALTWLLGMLFRLYVSGRILAASGQLRRPMPDIPSLTYPAGLGLGLAVALPLTLIGGTAGLAASAFAGAFLCAYMLLGLAIIHDISRGVSSRPLLLTLVYAGLLILNSWLALALALFALLSPLLPLKRGRAAPGSSPD